MENEPEVIRQQMQDNRTDLAEKLELLEERFLRTANTVADVVEHAKEGVEETVQSVRESVVDTAQEVRETVRETFDVRRHVDRHPWPAVGCAVGVGYLAGLLLGGRSGRREGSMGDWSGAPSSDSWLPEKRRERARTTAMPFEEGPSTSTPPRSESSSGGWTKMFEKELEGLKGLAIGAGVALARDVLVRSLPATIGQRVGELMNDFSARVGGQTIREPLLETETNGRRV